MTNVGEIGGQVDDVFGRQAMELVGLVGAAQNLTNAMTEQFGAAAVGSNNERVMALHGHLGRIQEGLGVIATEVAAAQQTSNELLAEWGIDSGGSTSDSKYDQRNPKRLSAMHHRGLYENLGIDLSNVGCIMLDTEPIKVADIIAPEDLYYANDPVKNPHTKGAVSEQAPHVTLLQGLVKPGPELKAEVDTMLEGWTADSVTIKEIAYFAGADPKEPFDCIVAILDTSGKLQEGNERLQMLPHVTMYPGGYRAHISLAYIQRHPERRDAYIKALNARYAGKKLGVRGINYGR
jgi:hypothetical protein